MAPISTLLRDLNIRLIAKAEIIDVTIADTNTEISSFIKSEKNWDKITQLTKTESLIQNYRV